MAIVAQVVRLVGGFISGVLGAAILGSIFKSNSGGWLIALIVLGFLVLFERSSEGVIQICARFGILASVIGFSLSLILL